MKRRNFFKLAGVSALSTVIPAVPNVLGDETKVNSKTRENFTNPFETEGEWYKSAFHAHTTSSDGAIDVKTRIENYRAKGFKIVAITDHRTTNDLSGYSDDNFLALSSIEFHPETYSGAPTHHFLGLGLPHPYKYNNNLSAQEMIDDIKSRGAKVFYAHPHWTGHSFVEMTEVSGYLGVEVHNDLCEGHSDSGDGRTHWDQMLNNGYRLSGLATDDIHSSEGEGQAWTMIKSNKLDDSSVLEALETGCFYATQGPEIKDCKLGDDMIIKIECSSVKKIVFRMSDAGAGTVIRAEDGEYLNSAEYNLTSKNPKWIRCEITDEDGKRAWTNPFFLRD